MGIGGLSRERESTFAAQMQGLCWWSTRITALVRWLAWQLVTLYQMSDDPEDNVNAERIVVLLKANMVGAGVKTVVIDI